MKKILFVLFVSVFAAAAVNAQKPEVVLTDKEGWHKIGQAKVDFKSEKDAFLIIGADKFKAIQIRVKDAPIRLEDLNVEYDGGVKEDIAIKSNFAANSKSRVIDLKNISKGLKKVEFFYKTVPNGTGDKAEIELWGLK